jgi:hypothetical protein
MLKRTDHRRDTDADDDVSQTPGRKDMPRTQLRTHRRTLARATASIMVTVTVAAAATLLAVVPASPASAAAHT